MTADERIDTASRLLRLMIDDCPNCRGTNRVGVMSAGGRRIEKCHVCAPLRGVLEILTNEESPPAEPNRLPAGFDGGGCCQAACG